MVSRPGTGAARRRYIEPELNVALILPDGRALEWWTDLDRTVDSFAEFSKRDAATLRRWVDEFRPIVEQILIPEAQSPPLPPERRRELLERSPLGRRLLEVAALSPLEFVEREFENDVIRAGLLFFNGLREIDLRAAGLRPLRFPRCSPAGTRRRCASAARPRWPRRWSPTSASMAARSAAAPSCKRDPGPQTAGRSAWSWPTASGSRRKAFVASGLNPQQTFLDLLDADAVPQRLRERRAAVPVQPARAAVRPEPGARASRRATRPRSSARSLNRAFMVILGLERFEQFHEIVAAHERGEIPADRHVGRVPDAVRSRARRRRASTPRSCGRSCPTPCTATPRTGTREKDAHGQAMLELWAQFAPNLARAPCSTAFTRSPLDTERTLPNMRRGDLLVGSFANGQIGYNRPFAGRRPVSHAGRRASTCAAARRIPGGNITGPVRLQRRARHGRRSGIEDVVELRSADSVLVGLS